MAVDGEAFRAVMGQWPSGVTVVTTEHAGERHGMTASSFSSVSLDPPLVSVCIAKHLHTHELIASSGVFGVNILSKDQIDHGKRFAGMLGDIDRFEGVDIVTAETGAPLLGDAVGWLDCKVWQAYDGGDHTIFVGEVKAADTPNAAAPLLYHSRAWGQFADVLIDHVTLHVSTGDEAVIEDAFRYGDPDEVMTAALPLLADEPEVLVLDDASGAVDPLLLRRCLQAVGAVSGRTPVSLRLVDHPMTLANAVVALKSGVRHLHLDGGINQGALVDMLDRMSIAHTLQD